MKVIFVGSSHGVPEPHRRCSCAIIEAGDNRYLIDAGTEPVPAFVDRGISLDTLKAVFITHMHGDHTNGLLSLVDLCSWFYRTTAFKVFLPEMSAVPAIRGWVNAVHDELRPEIGFAPVQEGVVYDDGVLKATALKTGHIPNAYAYIIEAEGKRVLFTGDMKHGDGPAADFARFIKMGTFDLAVAESAHFSADGYVEYLKQNPPKHFVLNHYSWRYAESCWRVRNELEGEIPVTLATDNLEITL